MATQTQTTTRQSRIEGTPAPPGAYPLQLYYIYGRPSSAPPGSQPPQPGPPPPDPSDNGPPSDDRTNGSVKGENDDNRQNDDNQDDDNRRNDDNQPDDDDPQDDGKTILDITPYQLNTREDFSGDVPLPPKNTGEGRYKEPAVFDDWCLKITDLFTLKGISLMDPKAIIQIGFYLDGKASEFHNNWRSQKGNKGVKSFLEDLRTWVIPQNYEHRLWSEFHRIKQRNRPIEEVLQELDMAKIRLLSITKEQMFHQLLDAMDTKLRS